MTPETLVILVASALTVPLFWLAPAKWSWTMGVLWTGLVIGMTSPISLLWLGVTTLGTVAAVTVIDRVRSPGFLVSLWCATLIAALFLLREVDTIILVGGAYFTLRNIHVLLDCWMQRLHRPSLRDMLYYQFFLPVFLVGPIHRFQTFQRSRERQRFDADDLAAGAERALIGLSLALVGGFVTRKIQTGLQEPNAMVAPFFQDWLMSSMDWVQLYFVFAGYSSFAIGIALMIGIRIEENFDRPWAARSLLEFWQRWHITLSLWCRDYVFNPVTAATRKPLIGLAAAMLAIGLWHESSVYYVLWAVWQALGIAGNRLIVMRAKRSGRVWISARCGAILGPIAVLGWLSLAKPVLMWLLQGFS